MGSRNCTSKVVRASVEVLSPDTRRIDEGEKCLAYTTIASLFAFVMVEQESKRVVVLRRAANGFVREQFAGGDVVPLPELGIELPLAEMYEGVDFGEVVDR